MKKLICVIAAAAMVLASATAFANSDEVIPGMGDKLYSGFVNTFTGWVEVPAQIAKGYKYGWMGEKNTGWIGAIGGLFAGIGSAAGRTISGMGQMAGFWAADPDSNEGIGIPLDAEYAWEEGTPYNMVDPDLTDATVKPVLRKLGRGAGNALFGVMEVPGQIMKGIQDKSPDLGIVKGLWYWFSREVDGVWDICTFCLPGPRENKAVAFDDKWPWSAMGDKSTKPIK